MKPVPADALARIARAGLNLQHPRSGPGNLWITTSTDDTLEVAKRISAAINATTFAFLGQRTSDAYMVAEFERGRCVSEVAFFDGQWTVSSEGSLGERPWHAELQFSEFFARLEIDDWSEADRARAAMAYETHNLAALPRLPNASFEQLQSFMVPYFDAAGGGAEYRKSGWLQRLLRRNRVVS